MKNKYVSGQFLRYCDASGFKFLSGKLVKQWDGQYVHPRYLDPIHPDLIRKKKESKTIRIF